MKQSKTVIMIVDFVVQKSVNIAKNQTVSMNRVSNSSIMIVMGADIMFGTVVAVALVR
jgi:hypothetical protein